MWALVAVLGRVGQLMLVVPIDRMLWPLGIWTWMGGAVVSVDDACCRKWPCLLWRLRARGGGGGASGSKATVYFRSGGRNTPPSLSSVGGFVGFAAAHCVFTCGIVLVARGFVLGGGTCVFVSNTVAVGPTVIAVVTSCAWTSGLFVVELFVFAFEIC